MLIDSLHEQVRRIGQLQADIVAIERRLSQQLRQSSACKAVAEIPGVGLMTATAVVSSMGSPTAFKDGREFAAWIGLVPRQTGTGGLAEDRGPGWTCPAPGARAGPRPAGRHDVGWRTADACHRPSRGIQAEIHPPGRTLGGHHAFARG
ncbi:hypothetical protein CDO46_10955 [Pigmentiphaga sp. NML030171]|nr:hypothetical protein CDO46_10955 [Pigmentiphaga sp. NML030171]